MLGESSLNTNAQAFKVILMGDAGTGKTSIINKFIFNKYNQFTTPTVGLENLTTKLMVDDREVILKIWDTAGQEQYTSLIPMFSRDSDVCVIVADISKEGSVKNIDKWIEMLHDSGENPPIIVAINKSDLPSYEPIELLESELSIKYPKLIFVSACNGKYIKELFDIVARTAVNCAQQKSEEADSKKLNTNNHSSSCC